MTRRYGIDVSHFQDPAHPAGNTWEELGRQSTFVMVRASYGSMPDARAPAHISAARIEAFQVGLYHFPVFTQDIKQQMDVFTAQAVKCGIVPGDILPALDIEDDGPTEVNPAFEPLVRQAVDILVARFGGAILYMTQRDFNRMGAPEWMLDYPLWVANYTNAPKPASPGNRAPAIWQYRVGPYAPGAPFDPKTARASNAIDQDLADAPIPTCTRTPSLPTSLQVDDAQARWRRRIDQQLAAEYTEINTGLTHVDPFEDTEPPTKPDNGKPIA